MSDRRAPSNPRPRALSSVSAPASLRDRPTFAHRLSADPAVALALLALWTLALHGPGFGKRGGDDAFFIEVARGWLHGAPPYLSAFDVKPPGYFFLLGLTELFAGPTQTAVNALTMISEVGAAFCLLKLGRRLANPAVGVFAAIAYPYLSQTLSNNPGYPPLAFATTGAFALATCEWRWRTRVWTSALALGFALTIKQSACLEALPLLWLLGREAQGRSLWPAAAIAAPPLGFALLFALQGAFAPFFADVVETALRRPGLEPETTAQVLAHFVSLQKMLLPLAVLGGLGVWRLRSLLPGAAAGRAEALALWLAAAWLELWLQHARWALYLGPTFAPLLLLSGSAVARAVASPGLQRAALALLLAATAIHVYPFRYWPLLAPENAAVYARATEIVKAQNPGPDDRLLGLGRLETVQLNTDTGLKAPTKYVYWLHLVCDFPGAGPQRLREALALTPRFLVVATDPYRPYCEDPAVWPLVRDTLSQSYRRIGQSPADAPQLLVYERQDAASP